MRCLIMASLRSPPPVTVRRNILKVCFAWCRDHRHAPSPQLSKQPQAVLNLVTVGPVEQDATHPTIACNTIISVWMARVLSPWWQIRLRRWKPEWNAKTVVLGTGGGAARTDFQYEGRLYSGGTEICAQVWPVEFAGRGWVRKLCAQFSDLVVHLEAHEGEIFFPACSPGVQNPRLAAAWGHAQWPPCAYSYPTMAPIPCRVLCQTGP